MTFLLDVNVLIALIDPTHLSHEPAHRWFAGEGARSWATCPITENGVSRIIGHAKYPNAPGSPGSVATLLRRFTGLPGHVFWPDDISLLDAGRIDPARLLTAGQITDTYLLALAVAHQGQLASLDRRLVPDAVPGGAEAMRLI